MYIYGICIEKYNYDHYVLLGILFLSPFRQQSNKICNTNAIKQGTTKKEDKQKIARSIRIKMIVLPQNEMQLAILSLMVAPGIQQQHRTAVIAAKQTAGGPIIMT